MAKQFKKTKLATAVCAAAGLGLASSANAVVVVGGDNGWEVSFDGNINAFYTVGDFDGGFTTLGLGNAPGTAPAIDTSRVASGFLPAFFSFNVKSPTVNGMTATGRFSFAPAIQNANNKNQVFGAIGLNGGLQGRSQVIQGSSIDMREVVVNLDGAFGTVSFGRTLSIFGRQAILKDMTLFGVGSSQMQQGSVAAGRIGRGYTYPNFNARFSYKTPNINGFQAEIGLYDPSNETLSTGNILNETDTPRFEGEVSYTTAFSGGSFQVWVDGLWQDIESSAVGATADVQVTGYGVGANVKVSGFDLVGYYYNGEGLGRSLQFVGGTRCNGAGTTCQENDADGYYVQGTYTFNGKTKIGASWGESSEDGFSANAPAGLGATNGVDLSMWTVGVYHDINSWLKVIAEYNHLENDWDNNAGSVEADTFSVGSFLFW
ncbi:MAG: porin [Pseudomonadota bacterium]